MYTNTTRTRKKRWKRRDKQLYDAVKFGRFDGVKWNIDKGADVNARDDENCSMLHNAVKSNTPDTLKIVKYLVEHGATVDVWTLKYAAQTAARNSNPDMFAIIRYIVEHGEQQPDGSWLPMKDVNFESPLCDVVLSENADTFEMVKYLVERDADVNAEEGLVLSHVAGSHHPDALAIMKYLVGKGASFVGTALERAAENTNFDAFAMVRFLMEHPNRPAHDVNEYYLQALANAAGNRNNDSFAMVKYLMEDESYSMCSGRHEEWVLSRAAGNSTPDAFAMVKYLVESGIHVNANCGQVLNYAVRSASPDAFAIVKYLAEQDSGFWCGAKSEDALLYAMSSFNADLYKIVEYLLELKEVADNGETCARFDVHWCNTGIGCGTALSTALYYNKEGIADRLLWRDDFLLSDLMPRHDKLEEDVYEPFRDKAVHRVIDLLEKEGPEYAREVAKDIDIIIEINNEKHRRILNERDVVLLLTVKEIAMERLLSFDRLLPSDVMPRLRIFHSDEYKIFREQMVPRVSDLVGKNGFEYGKTVAADIEKILKDENTKLTKEDVKALGTIAKKISSRDWVCDAQISSSDFDYALDEMER